MSAEDFIGFGETVFICENCKCGFLRLPPNNLHDGLPWATLNGPVANNECWGSIEPIPRAIALRNARFEVEIFDAEEKDR